MKLSKRQLKKMIREMHHEEQEWYTDQDETLADYKYRVAQEENELDAEELGGIHDDFEEEEVKPLRQRDQRLAASPRRSGMGRRHESASRITKGQIKRIIKEEKSRIIQERLLLKEAVPVIAGLAGAGLLIALGSKGGRSLIAKVLRIQGNVLDKLETIDDRMADVTGREWPILDEISELAAEMAPQRLALDELADLLEGLTDEEGEALNDALAPVKAGTPVGRMAAAGQAANKLT